LALKKEEVTVVTSAAAQKDTKQGTAVKCAVCREDIKSDKECPRCGFDNSGVEDVEWWRYFASFWAALSFLLVFATLLLLLPGIRGRADEAVQPVASIRVGGPIILLITLISAYYVYTLRDRLHEYELLRSVQKRPGRPLEIWALILFSGAVFFTFFLAFSIVSKDSIVGSGLYTEGRLVEGSTAHLSFKLVMTGVLILIFALFVVAAGLMATYEYGLYVDAHRPDPIFLDEKRLSDVILGAMRDELESDGEWSAPNGERPENAGAVRLQVADRQRLEDGGLALTIRHEGELTTRHGNQVLERKEWHVEADRWGRVRKRDEQNAVYMVRPEETPEE
jgi:rubredoxin